MNSKIINKVKGYKPLVYLGSQIILGWLDKIYIADLKLEHIRYVCSLEAISGLLALFARFRLFQRLFRLELGPATLLDEKGRFLVFFRGKAFEVDIEARQAKQELLPKGLRRPLRLTRIQSGINKGLVLFGEYQRNYEYNPVNIYCRLLNGKWIIIYTFSKGLINHIHGIFEDVQRECFYILTGDFDQGACIWKTDATFSSVYPLFRNAQMSRACWIKSSKNELFFATDQQESINYFCSLSGNHFQDFKRHFPIMGSSIYYSDTHSDIIIFSTAVEPPSANKITFNSLLSRSRAPGILSDHSFIYVGSIEIGFRVLFMAKKDNLPFGLFQFGTINFPFGDSCDTSYVHFYCSALSGNDNTTYVMKIDKPS